MIIASGIALTVNAYGHVAAAPHEFEHLALYVGHSRYLRMVNLLENTPQRQVVLHRLKSEHALGWGRYKLAGIECYKVPLRQVYFEAAQPGTGQHDGVEVALPQLIEARGYVAPDVVEDNVGSEVEQLRLAPRRRSPYNGALFKLKKLPLLHSCRTHNEPIGRIFSIGNRRDCQPLGLGSWQVFHRMHRHVNIAAQQGVFNFFGKKALALDFIETQMLYLVAFSFNDGQFTGYAHSRELLAGKFSLPKGELTAAGTDPDGSVQNIFFAKIINALAPIVNRVL